MNLKPNELTAATMSTISVINHRKSILVKCIPHLYGSLNCASTCNEFIVMYMEREIRVAVKAKISDLSFMV